MKLSISSEHRLRSGTADASKLDFVLLSVQHSELGSEDTCGSTQTSARQGEVDETAEVLLHIKSPTT